MKKKMWIISIVVLLSGFGIREELLIKWSPKILKWSDFKGTPTQKDTDIIALTCSRIEYSLMLTDSLVFNVTNNFITKKSWTTTGCENILNHEQRHFYLSEATAREMRKVIIKSAKQGKSKSQIGVAADSVFDNLAAMQNTYDIETSHGTNDLMQKKWNVKIDKWLVSLNQYSETHYCVEIKKNHD